jgi:uncharacterized protein
MAEALEQQMEMPANGDFCWTEIATHDLTVSKEFYANVFGWNFKGGNAGVGMEYPEFMVGDGYPMGGMYQISAAMFGDDMPPPHFLNYIAVDDVDAFFAKAIELGATGLKEPVDIPNTGRFCIINDPTGGMVALFKMGEN